jgi:rRNA maturation protein Nop10
VKNPLIKKCPKHNHYTLEDSCEGEDTLPARPPKFSHPDRHGKYRRKTKKEVE